MISLLCGLAAVVWRFGIVVCVFVLFLVVLFCLLVRPCSLFVFFCLVPYPDIGICFIIFVCSVILRGVGVGVLFWGGD